MKLHYYKFKTGRRNFGDDLNPWLWNKIFPDFFDEDENRIFVGIGTLINNESLPKAKETIVFSSGFGYGTVPQVDKSWKIYCLRGPLSAEKIGVSRDLAVTDGAVLIRKYFSPTNKKKHKYSYMPHIMQACAGGEIWKKMCDSIGISYIDPQGNINDVIDSINKTEYLISEALHGAIIADSLRVPWLPVKSNDEVFEFKWNDWCASVKLSYQPTKIFPLWDNGGGVLHQSIFSC